MTPTVPCNNGSIMKIRYFKISEHNYDNVVRRDVISIYMLLEFIENRKEDSCEITKEKALEIALLEL